MLSLGFHLLYGGCNYFLILTMPVPVLPWMAIGSGRSLTPTKQIEMIGIKIKVNGMVEFNCSFHGPFKFDHRSWHPGGLSDEAYFYFLLYLLLNKLEYSGFRAYYCWKAWVTHPWKHMLEPSLWGSIALLAIFSQRVFHCPVAQARSCSLVNNLQWNRELRMFEMVI